MRLVRRVTVGALLAVPAVALIGLTVRSLMLPPRYTAAGIVEVAAPVDAVYDLVTDPQRVGEWQPGVEIRDVGRQRGVQRFRVEGPAPYVFEVTDAVRPQRFVSQIVPEGGIGGTFTWTFEPLGSVTRVILVHDAVVTQPLPRAVLGLTGAEDSAVEAQLSALKSAFANGDPP